MLTMLEEVVSKLFAFWYASKTHLVRLNWPCSQICLTVGLRLSSSSFSTSWLCSSELYLSAIFWRTFSSIWCRMRVRSTGLRCNVWISRPATSLQLFRRFIFRACRLKYCACSSCKSSASGKFCARDIPPGCNLCLSFKLYRNPAC